MDKSPDNTDSFVAGLLAPFIIPLIAALIVPAVLARAYVLSHLWTWYAQPLGAPHLRVAYAFGVCLMASAAYWTAPVKKPNKDLDYPFWVTLTSAVVGPFLMLLIGWLGTFFI